MNPGKTALNELFAQKPLFKPVTRVEKDTMSHVGIGVNLDPEHVVDRDAVGIRHHRALFRLDHIKAHHCAVFGSSAPRQRRGRNAATAVSASTSDPIGRIGPCAL